MVGRIGEKKINNALKRKFSFKNIDASSLPTPDIESCNRNQNVPIIDENTELRNRKEVPRYVPTEWDDSLPYGGKVYLARQKKPESWLCIIIQIFLVISCMGLVYYGFYYTDHLHYHAIKLYAKLGHKEAQAIVGHMLLHGHGIEQNHTEAMVWLHEAAKQGHPHAAYNVAVGHLQGIKTSLLPGDAKRMIKHAADNGVAEAVDVYTKVCSKGKCDD